MLREHRIFVVEYEVDGKERVEDRHGELAGYRSTGRVRHTANIIAPSENIACIYVMDRFKKDRVEITHINALKIDAFIQSHVI